MKINNKIITNSFIFFLISMNLLFSNENKYYSQYEQDKFVNETFFKDKKDGFFVDIGAFDGITISNSYFFEKTLGWKGICVEPLPEPFELLKNCRDAICFNGCVDVSNGIKPFLQVNNVLVLSGLLKTYDPRHLQRAKNEAKEKGGSIQKIFTNCITFNDLLAQTNQTKIDLLSIDTEGNELDILKSIDYDKYDIDIIMVENNYNNPQFKTFLTKKGYKFIRNLGCDEIYKKNYQYN
jgi:FkbM family methyltransferase